MKLITTIFLSLFINLAFAQEAKIHEVKMLNKGSDGKPMAFEPAFLNVKVGDSIKFIPTDKGHEVQSVKKPGSLPKGVKAFKGKRNKEIIVKFEKEGAYMVECKPHTAMGMVGLYVAGKPTNLAEVKKVKLMKKAQQRMDGYLKQAEAIK